MNNRSTFYGLALLFLLTASRAFPQGTDIGVITEHGDWKPGLEDPTPVALSGFSGEVDRVIRFDLYVRGFKFVPPQEAKYLISGSNSGAVQGQVTAPGLDIPLLPMRRYSGTSLRRQAHAFSDDVVRAIRPGALGIAQTRIACKVDKGQNTEIVISDFDGHGAQSITRSDNSLAKSPAWGSDGKTLFYTSYKRGPAEIFRHNTKTGDRLVVAGYGGSNLMPAPSPDGSKVAMILSKSGHVDLYVANADGSGLKRLTNNKEDESSPCWSPDGKWICFATKIGVRRVLAKVSPTEGKCSGSWCGGSRTPASPTGRRTANGSHSRRRWEASSCVSFPPREGTPLFWSVVMILPGHPIPEPWCSTDVRAAATPCLCLTCPPNSSRMSPDFGKQ